MSKILKPRRGSKAVMSTTKASTVLAAGEIFFESNGTIGASKNCALKMGDGSTAYADLPYFIDGDIANVEITSIADKSSVTSITSCLSDVTTGKTLGTVIGAMKQALSLTAQQFDEMFPIGHIIHSYTCSTEALVKASYRGNSWSQITDRFLYGSTSAGTTGGESRHTLTIYEIPSHTHNTKTTGQSGSANQYWYNTGYGYAGTSHTVTDAAGGGQSHNNMPPYITCYIWRRVS